MKKMPEINLNAFKDNLTPDQVEVVKEVLYCAPTGKTTLRIGKPRNASPIAQMVWKHLAYHLSPEEKDIHLPVIPMDFRETDVPDEVRKLVEIVVASVPDHQRFGDIQWADHF